MSVSPLFGSVPTESSVSTVRPRTREDDLFFLVSPTSHHPYRPGHTLVSHVRFEPYSPVEGLTTHVHKNSSFFSKQPTTETPGLKPLG